MELAAAVWTGIPERPTVLLPIGSTEQHGPHLPLSTDTLVAAAVAARLAEQTDAVLAPAIPYGSSGEHQDFPGTVSIGREALAAVVTEAVRSLRTWAARVIIVSGHGGNAPVLASVVPILRDEGSDIGWLPCTGSGTLPADAHAGRTETSLLLHLAPDAVHLAAAAPGETRPIAELLPELEHRGVRALAPNGVLGDPTGASAAEGRMLFEELTASALRRIRAEDVDARGMLRDPGAGR